MDSVLVLVYFWDIINWIQLIYALTQVIGLP